MNEWNPRDADVVENQVREYDALRAKCPVAHSDYLGWSVFRHDDVVTVLEDPGTFSSAVSAHPSVPNGYDPPLHTAYRRIIDRYFTKERMAAFEPDCRALAAELVESVPRDEEVDFIEGFALTFALRAQRQWLGWPVSVETALRDWVGKNHRATLAGDRKALAAVAAEFDDVVRHLLASRRAAGADAPRDVTGDLLAEEIDGVALSDAELVSILRNFTVGELGTIAASVGIVTHYLAAHQELQQQLRAAPQALSHAIDEILRIHPPLIANRRTATRDVELGGRQVTAGERVTVIWASANRDEAVFGDPDEYQPEHNAAENLLYGRGIHDCPGAPLARLELTVLVEALFAGTDRIELVSGSAPDFAAYPGGGFRSLPLRLIGRADTRQSPTH